VYQHRGATTGGTRAFERLPAMMFIHRPEPTDDPDASMSLDRESICDKFFEEVAAGRELPASA
jgi:hypothetical protein